MKASGTIDLHSEISSKKEEDISEGISCETLLVHIYHFPSYPFLDSTVLGNTQMATTLT